MKQVEVRTCRPVKHLAVVFTIIALILVIVAVSSANWVDVKIRTVDAYQNWGLWQECYKVADSTTQICVSKDWMSACGAFVIITLIACIGSVPLGVIGLCTKTRLWYIIAGILCVAGAVCDIIALIIYPAKFTQEINDSKAATGWDFDWTYGIAWGGLFFMVGAAVLFFVRIEEEDTVNQVPDQFYDNRMT